MSKISCFLVCVIFLHYCNGLDVCGLEDVPKVGLTDVKGIQNKNLAVMKWSVTPNGKGHFLVPLDPLKLNDVSFTVADNKFILRNVQIKGLLNSDLKLTITGSNENTLYGFRFTHNVILEADSSVKIHLKNGDEYFDDSPVKVELSDLVTDHVTNQQVVQRCDGHKYILLNPTELEVRSGVTNILSGLFEQINDVDVGDFGMTLVETISLLCTGAINNNDRQFHSIVKYNDIIAK